LATPLRPGSLCLLLLFASGRQLFEIDASLFAYDDIDDEELPEF
jgi:hypothetical protein